jgi:uncharacterized YigZ family protein
MHQNANHNCWCYRLGKMAEWEHASDAGEPAGTAGKPMLGELKKAEISDVVAVVTRYFGGIKLGVSGLIEAYSTAVRETLALAEKWEIIEKRMFNIETTYDFAERLKYDVQSMQAVILSIDYSSFVSIKIEVEESLAENLEHFLMEMEKIKKLKILEN